MSSQKIFLSAKDLPSYKKVTKIITKKYNKKNILSLIGFIPFLATS